MGLQDRRRDPCPCWLPVSLSLEVAFPAGLSTLGSTQVGFSSAFPLLLVQEMCVQRLGDVISASFPVSILMLRPVWQLAANTSGFQRKQNLLRSPSHAVLIILDQGGWGEFCERWKAPSLLTLPHLVIILALGSLQFAGQAGGTHRRVFMGPHSCCALCWLLPVSGEGRMERERKAPTFRLQETDKIFSLLSEAGHIERPINSFLDASVAYSFFLSPLNLGVKHCLNTGPFKVSYKASCLSPKR